MARASSRQLEAARILYFPSHPGNRAVFLAEARTKREIRQIRELFDMVGQLAQVVPISHGTVMSYAVQTHDDAAIFGKIEWLLKTQFSFSLVERNFSDVTFHLVRSLCEDAASEMIELPSCEICSTADPFPTRVTVELQNDDPMHLAYCGRCSAASAEEDEERAVRGLLQRTHTSLRVPRGVPVVPMPEIVEERPEWEDQALAVAG